MAAGEGATRADIPRERREALGFVAEEAEFARGGAVASNPRLAGVQGDANRPPESRTAAGRHQNIRDRAAAVTNRESSE